MMDRTGRRMNLLAALAVLAVMAAAPAVTRAASSEYSPEAYEKAKREGKVIVLDFHAGWCPTCRKQATVLAELVSEDAISKGVAVLQVDFDNSDKLKQDHKVASQSTLIVIKDDKEIARAVGIVEKEQIRALIEKAL